MEDERRCWCWCWYLIYNERRLVVVVVVVVDEGWMNEGREGSSNSSR